MGGKEGAKGWVYTYGTTKSDSEEVTSISHAYSESIAGSAGSGGMHGWILPTNAGWLDLDYADAYSYHVYSVEVSKFINIKNLAAGVAPKDGVENTSHSAVDLDSTTGTGRAWQCGFLWLFYESSGTGYVFDAHYPEEGVFFWEFEANDCIPIKQVIISVLYGVPIYANGGIEVNNESSFDEEDAISNIAFYQNVPDIKQAKVGGLFSDKCSECK